MECDTNIGCVLKKKARIYAWPLIGFIPTWAYGLTECYVGPDSAVAMSLQLIANGLVVASLCIVIWRWEAIERRKIARRARILPLAISFLLGFVVFGTFVKWCTDLGGGMYLPIALSSAPLSAILAVVRLGPDSASALGQVCDILQTLGMWVILWGTPAVWGAMALLGASPHTRRRARLFVATILSHDVVGVMVVVLMTAGDWECLRDIWYESPEALIG